MPSMASWRGSPSGSANSPAARATRRSRQLVVYRPHRYEGGRFDRCEAETLSQLLDDGVRFGMIRRHEDHAASTILHRAFIEAVGDDRIEGLDEAGTGRQSSRDLTGALAAEI